MIDVNSALKAVLEHTSVLQTETIPLTKALHSVLAETITARDDIPLFNSSAMDGYGVKVSDVQYASDVSPVELKIVGTVKAGEVLKTPIEPGTAVKIFTGAKVPEGVEAVVIKENTEEIDGKVLIKSSAKLGANIRQRGEEFLKGDKVLSPGILITPPVIGLLAEFGYIEVCIHRKPKVAVVVTGDELIDPKKPLEEGKIRDVNSFTIQAALEEVGAKVVSLKRVPDSPEKILKAVSQSLQSADILLVSGGVSVGDFDFVKEIFENVGIERVFWKVALKPGKPTFFGTKGEKLVFGLPGNPVSVLVTFYLFVRPALLRMMGRKEIQPIYLPALMNSEVKKKKGRTEFLRAKLQSQNGNIYVGVGGEQYSHMLSSFANSDCLAVFPKEQTNIAEDGKVQIQLLPWATL